MNRLIRKLAPDQRPAALAILAEWNMAPRRPGPGLAEPERSELDPTKTFVALADGVVIGVASC